MSKQEKKAKKVQLTLDNMKAGMTMKDLHGKDVQIDDDLIEQMRRYEQESNKNAIWKNKITGHFIHYKWIEEHPEYLVEKEKSKAERMEKRRKARESKKENKVETEIEKEMIDEENLMLDCIADYQKEFGVKKVNTNTKKFKAFFEEWKNSN